MIDPAIGKLKAKIAELETAVKATARQRDHECERANRFYRFCVSNPDVMKRFLADEWADEARAAPEQGE